VGQSNLWYSGCRRVRDKDHYFEHSPTGRLVAIGGYGEIENRWTNLNVLIALRAAGRLCTNKLYTCLIMNNQPEFTPAYIAAFDAALKSYTNVPNLRWTGITNTVRVWQADYAGEPSILPYYLNHDVDEDGLDDGWEVTNNCDISWSTGAGDWDGDGQTDRDEYVAATSPVDAASLFVVTAITNTTAGPVIQWASAPGRSYRVDTGTLTGGWSEVYSVGGSGAALSFTNATGDPFQRVRVLW
jgi:hypothetical protein